MSAFNAYTDTAVTTQNNGKIIVMLYEGAIKFMKLAISEIQAGNNQKKGEYIQKAINIINELNAVLDVEQGGEIAQNLRKLYLFMNTHLAKANASKDTQMIKEVITICEELNDSFKSISV